VKIKAEEKHFFLESEHEKAAIMVLNVKYYVHCNAVLIVNIFPA
jgi:hypothetical protein